MKRKKRRSRYKRGDYVSEKTGMLCKYRSGWEFAYMQYLDANLSVASWHYESLKISYVSNKNTGRLRTYFPDFDVTYVDGSRCIIEIKQKRKISTVAVKKKSAAAITWCAENNCKFVLITEDDLKRLHLI